MRIRKLRKQLKKLQKEFGNVEIVSDLSWDTQRIGYYTRPPRPMLDDSDGRIHL